MILNRDSCVAVVGAGAMGSGIAQVAARAGHRVVLVDTGEDALNRSRVGLTGALEKLVGQGKMDALERDGILARMHWTTDMAEVAPARLVVEAIIEDRAIKSALFVRLAELVAPDAILASNTSSLSIDEIGAHIPQPERFAGLHFFNPVPVMKLVEVVPGQRTDALVTEALLALMQQWGKVAVRVRDVPGFIVNRVARPYYAEGFAALGEGIDAAAIDQALTGAGGFRMGPLMLADMIGHDVNYVVARSVYDAYDGHTRFRPQPSQQALYEGGTLGRKSGGGVYDYGAPLPQPVYVTPGSAPDSIGVSRDHQGLVAIVEQARQAGLEVIVAEDLPAGTLRVGEVVIALGDGRPLSRRAEVDVLLDQARDFGAAATWIISAHTDASAAAAAGLADRLGKQTLLLPDRPGLIVLRTLAQLANAAADAVEDAVASAQDIDAAMRFGANHPEGPLEWAGRYGHARLAAALSHIADETGDAMYRPSPYFGSVEDLAQ